MTKSYEAFLADPENVPQGVEIRLFVKDLTSGPRKYDSRFVKARVSSSPDRLPGSDTLRIRSLDGKLHPNLFAIQIVQELGEYVPGLPYTLHTGLFPEEQK
jgi:hypothetical protein